MTLRDNWKDLGEVTPKYYGYTTERGLRHLTNVLERPVHSFVTVAVSHWGFVLDNEGCLS
jgi:hypothetical protein